MSCPKCPKPPETGKTSGGVSVPVLPVLPMGNGQTGRTGQSSEPLEQCTQCGMPSDSPGMYRERFWYQGGLLCTPCMIERDADAYLELTTPCDLAIGDWLVGWNSDRVKNCEVLS